MANITIRNLDDDVRTQIRVRAAENGCSMEEEVRVILRDAVMDQPQVPGDLVAFARECFGAVGGVELELPPRGPRREPPDLS